MSFSECDMPTSSNLKIRFQGVRTTHNAHIEIGTVIKSETPRKWLVRVMTQATGGKIIYGFMLLWIGLRINQVKNRVIFVVVIVLGCCLPCCSIRSLFGSVHEMNATAYQSPVFGPSMLNRLIDPSDLNCKLYISNLQKWTRKLMRKLISNIEWIWHKRATVKWHTIQ